MTTPTYTHITASGLLARIVCTDRDAGSYPVIALVKDSQGEIIIAATANLKAHNPLYNLTPLPPYHDFKIDEPVMVRNLANEPWAPRYFAGVESGKPKAWNSGATRWSAGTMFSFWAECRRPTPEELEGV